jgi:hypothetical protein
LGVFCARFPPREAREPWIKKKKIAAISQLLGRILETTL